MTEAAPPVPASRQGRRLRLALAVAGVAVLAAVLALYAARRTIARETLTAWLKSKGVEAVAEVQAIGLTGVTGSLTVGDPGHPDLTVERAEIGYGLKGLGLEVRSVRLVRPVLRARLHKGKLTAGALDPLIEEFRKAPPRPSAVQPRIAVEDAILLLRTDYGLVRLHADGQLEDGRLQRLKARIAPTRLRSDSFDLSLGEVGLAAQSAGERVELSLDAPVASARAGQLAADGARLRVTAAGPYPDLKARREDGALVAHAELAGGRLAIGRQALRNGLVSAALTGQVSGWIDDLTVAGRAVADLRAAGAEAPGGGVAGPLHATASADDLRWSRKGGADTVRARLAASGTLDSFVQKDIKLAKVTAAARGPVAVNRRGLDLDLATSALGHGAWTGLGGPTAGDSAEIAAAKRAAAGFRFTAPAVAVRSTGGELRARLAQPVRLIPDRGGAVTLAPHGSGWRLTAAGGGLPQVDADVSRFALTPGGAVANGKIKAALSIGPIEQGVFDASGTLGIAGGTLSFTGDRCALVSAKRLNFGGNDAHDFTNRLCPAGGPLFTLGGGGDWRVFGRAEATAAEVPFLQAKIAKGAGAMDLGARRGVLQAKLTIAAAEVTDAAPQTRFRPVAIAGQAQLAHDFWTAKIGVRDGAGRPLATALIRHDVPKAHGQVAIDTGTLTFAPGGLQPAELSPLAAPLASPVDGQVRFTGGFAWTLQAQTSSGLLEVPKLDFVSPAGRVTGLSGRIAFNSLAPLTAAPGQVLQAAVIASPLGPVTDGKIVFGLRPEALVVTGGQATLGQGLVKVDSLEVPLTPGPPIRGLLEFDGMQLHDLVESSPFGDRVKLDAKVSGRLPFTYQGDKVRVQGGTLHAIQPGRLSIQRSALTGVETTGGAVAATGAPAEVVPEPSTDTFSDFAYQAMENLAFSTLSANIDSRPDGRLAVLFHVIGKHDPPQHQEIRLSLIDLIQKKFLNRKLPLPSGTGVNLTLDTTLNLDDLLSDYAQFRRRDGSAQVQP